MITIHKYPLVRTVEQGITVPTQAVWLDVQIQNDGIVLWAKVDAERSKTDRTVIIVGTGWDMEPLYERYGVMDYIGTVQDGALVWHIFVS